MNLRLLTAADPRSEEDLAGVFASVEEGWPHLDLGRVSIVVTDSFPRLVQSRVLDSDESVRIAISKIVGVDTSDSGTSDYYKRVAFVAAGHVAAHRLGATPGGPEYMTRTLCTETGSSISLMGKFVRVRDVFTMRRRGIRTYPLQPRHELVGEAFGFHMTRASKELDLNPTDRASRIFGPAFDRIFGEGAEPELLCDLAARREPGTRSGSLLERVLQSTNWLGPS